MHLWESPLKDYQYQCLVLAPPHQCYLLVWRIRAQNSPLQYLLIAKCFKRNCVQKTNKAKLHALFAFSSAFVLTRHHSRFCALRRAQRAKQILVWISSVTSHVRKGKRKKGNRMGVTAPESSSTEAASLSLSPSVVFTNNTVYMYFWHKSQCPAILDYNYNNGFQKVCKWFWEL